MHVQVETLKFGVGTAQVLVLHLHPQIAESTSGKAPEQVG